MISLFKNIYHYFWALGSAVFSRFPAKELVVIGVTGTKGKSTTTEYINAILEEAQYTTALAGTIRFKIGNESRPNKTKMTMIGRGFLQRFMREARNKGCTHAVLELSSQGVPQHRHRFIPLTALVFTGLHKEHIEAHGSFEKYAETKLQLLKNLTSSRVRRRAAIAFTESPYADRVLAAPIEVSLPYSLKDADNIKEGDRSVSFSYKGHAVCLHTPGTFNVLNALAALKVAEFLQIDLQIASRALSNLSSVPGRVEFIDEGQPFDVVVDYAHTPDSLRALYQAFPHKTKVCVLGNTGGGRDTWKRPEMAKIAEDYCRHVILTDEDPYNEDPAMIVEDMKKGMHTEPTVIMDRKEAIRAALQEAKEGEVVLISGKGTDPYIMRTEGRREPWSDATVTRELLRELKS
jgi:UDP-N-acetylmuramoyl-L-alanyl-D-glutamate--2,6-diaminopimelate ligase